jgi:hypothetical protein
MNRYIGILLIIFLILFTGCVNVNIDGENFGNLTETSVVFDNSTKLDYANNSTENFPDGLTNDSIDTNVLLQNHNDSVLRFNNYTIKSDRNFDRSNISNLATLVNLRTENSKKIDLSKDYPNIYTNTTTGRKNIETYYNGSENTVYSKIRGNELFKLNSTKSSVRYGKFSHETSKKDLTYFDLYKLFLDSSNPKYKGKTTNNNYIYSTRNITNKRILFGNSSLNTNNTRLRFKIHEEGFIKEIRFRTFIDTGNTSLKSYLITEFKNIDNTSFQRPEWTDVIEEGTDNSGPVS